MPGDNQALIQSLYNAYKNGPDALGQVLAATRDQLTPEVGGRLLDDYTAALQRQAPGEAIAAATIASRAFTFMGRNEEAFNALIDVFYVQFLLAETEAAYANIQLAVGQLVAGNAYTGTSPLIALRPRMLAADCCFFACEAVTDDERKRKWLETALQWLAAGIPFLVAESSGLHAGYASTAVAVYRRAVERGWAGQPWAAASLAKITQALDHAAPARLDYEKPSKTALIDAARAEMSAIYNHGSYRPAAASPTNLPGLFGRKNA